MLFQYLKSEKVLLFEKHYKSLWTLYIFFSSAAIFDLELACENV